MNASLQRLRDLLENTNFDSIVPVHREDLENVVAMAETVGLDVSNVLERFDAVVKGYQLRLHRQSRAIGELIGRRIAAEDALRALAKDENIPPAVIEAFGAIMTILRNGKPNAS